MFLDGDEKGVICEVADLRVAYCLLLKPPARNSYCGPVLTPVAGQSGYSMRIGVLVAESKTQNSWFQDANGERVTIVRMQAKFLGS